MPRRGNRGKVKRRLSHDSHNAWKPAQNAGSHISPATAAAGTIKAKAARTAKIARSLQILAQNRKNTLDTKELTEVLDEIVPTNERGKFLIGTFDNITCLPENDCQGVQGKWEKVGIYRNGGTGNEHYATIQWHREECRSAPD